MAAQGQPGGLDSIVQLSRKLGDALKIRLSTETQLAQLTLFQNLTELIKGNDRVLESIFQVRALVDTSDLLLLTVENTSEDLRLDPSHWYFSFELKTEGCPSVVSIWNLERPLEFERAETFHTKLCPSFNPVIVSTSLIFTLNLTDENSFGRVFNLSTITLDILHVLSPSRPMAPDSEFNNICNWPGSGYLLSTSGNPDCDESDDDGNILPPILTFHLKCNDLFRKAFPSLFFADSLHRGFPNDPGTIPLQDLTVYVHGERVQLSESHEGIRIQTFNSQVLYPLKMAIYKRLLKVEGLRIQGPNDSECDRLYRIKLGLQEFTTGVGEDNVRHGRVEEIALLHELYASLRTAMIDGLKFYLDSVPTSANAVKVNCEQESGKDVPTSSSKMEVPPPDHQAAEEDVQMID